MKNKYFIALFYTFLSVVLISCKKKSNVNLARTFYEQSVLEAEGKNIHNAIQLIDKSIDTSPTHQAYTLKASLFYQNKEYEKSLAIFQHLLKDKGVPANVKADIFNNVACINLSLGKIDEARKIWQELTLNTSYLSPEVAWFNLGMLDLSHAMADKENFHNKLKIAQKYFGKAIDIASEYIDAYYYLAITYLHLKEYNRAKEVVISLLTIEPNHEPAKELMETINQELNKELTQKK